MSDDTEKLSDMTAVIRMIQYLIDATESLTPPAQDLSVALEDALEFARQYQRNNPTDGG